MASPIVRRVIDGVYLFDAHESACNGEPNDGGRPRQDPETGRLWWNDSALKRFFRNALLDKYHDSEGHRVLVQQGYALNSCQDEALAALGHDPQGHAHMDDDGAEKTKKRKKRLDDDVKLGAREWIAKNFADVRWFGCVLDTGYQLGNLTGPLQFSIARSVHPVTVSEGAVTRCTVTTVKDLEEVKDRDMGTKYLVPYALFRGRIAYTPKFGELAGFTVDDLADFCEILKNPFRSRQSSSLGMVTLRKAWLFLHDSFLGNEQLGSLDERISVECDEEAPSSIRDFTIRFDDAGLENKGIQVFTEESLDDLVAAVAKRPGKAR